MCQKIKEEMEEDQMNNGSINKRPSCFLSHIKLEEINSLRALSHL